MRKLVNMRLPVELLARVDSVCGSRGRTEFTVRALEAALRQGGETTVGTPSATVRREREAEAVTTASVSRVVAPPRVPAFDARAAALERQALLNKAKGF